MEKKKSIKEFFLNIINFIKSDVWRLPIKELSKTNAFFIRILRIIVLAIRGFIEDKVQLRASALTYFTMLSIVPVVAMAFGIAKGFGLEKMLENQLRTSLSGQEEVINWIIRFANNMLENAKGGWIAGIGVIVLFWAVLKVLGNIESSFNGIWQIKKGRGLARKFTDYLSILLIAPLLVILSSSASVYISAQVRYLSESSSIFTYIGPFIVFLIRLIPYFLVWILFTVVYMIMPNTKVSFKSAILAGIIAGTIFQVVQWFYIYFQVGVSKYNAVYGGFAALPLFLIWLRISWIIVLFGAEISFAEQNVHKYEFESDLKDISYAYKKVLALLTTNLVVKEFEDGNNPLTGPQISGILKIPIRIIREILYDLVECKIFTEIHSDKSKERSYQPALDINKISVDYVLSKIENLGTSSINVSKTKEYDKIIDILDSFKSKIATSKENMLVKNI